MQKLLFYFSLTLIFLTTLRAQKSVKPIDLGAVEEPLGAKGVKWYTTWDTGLKEAQRSNRPIFFFAAAAQCGAISGTF